jgi:tRNA-dihydrouridine synthase A
MNEPSASTDAAPLADASLCVAPMMAWTTRHCRFLHRLLAPRALLFTEMVSTGAIEHGRCTRGLEFDPREQPLALQLGGSDPDALARCAAMAAERGFTEINLNVGCPSDRVQNGRFGACLMRDPDLVAACVRAMKAAARLPVSVKCRLGIDDQESDAFVSEFMHAIARAGCDRIYVHARKAVLSGLNPAQNRSIPPLKYEQAYRIAAQLRASHPTLGFVLNGGIASIEEAQRHRQAGFGVMIGRAAWHNPLLLAQLNALWFGTHPVDLEDVVDRYLAYADQALDQGVRFTELSRPLFGIARGRPGARRFRGILSDLGTTGDCGTNRIREALAVLQPAAA